MKNHMKKNFTTLFVPLSDLRKNCLAYLLIWSQNCANQARFIFFLLIFVRMEGPYWTLREISVIMINLDITKIWGVQCDGPPYKKALLLLSVGNYTQ